MPQSPAGCRIDPPVSDPSASGTMRAATAAARSAARSAGRARHVPRILRRAERGVLGGRAHRELVEVGLADDDRAGLLRGASTTVALYGGTKPARIFDDAVVGTPARAHVVLDRDRHAVQRSASSASPASRARARSSARSAITVLNADSDGSSCLIRSSDCFARPRPRSWLPSRDLFARADGSASLRSSRSPAAL